MAAGAPIHPCVLVVDDVAHTRQLMAKLIYQRGYDTLEAANSIEARGVLRERGDEICAIVLDVGAERRSVLVLDESDPEGDFACVPLVVVPIERDVRLRPSFSRALDIAVTRYCLSR